MNRRYLTIPLLSACLLWAAVVELSAAPLDGALEQLLRARDLRGTRYSICVIDADNGEVLGEINADEPMIPASNMKLLTTASALEVLGKDFAFRTELGVIDAPAGGGQATLVLHGDGDPALGDPVLLKEAGLTADDLLDQWVQAVKQTGITSFDRLIVDDRVFDQQMVHPSWPAGQLHQHYCAQVAGLNFNDNCLHVLPAPASRVGASPTISIYPESPFLQIFNSATTGSANEFWVDRKAGTNEMTMRGRVKSRFYTPVRVTLNDPPVYLGRLIKDRLGRAGIRVGQIVRPADGEQVPEARPIHRVETLMPAILRRTNQDSQNLFAEAQIKRMGYALTGSPGGWENGAAAIRHALSRRLGTLASGVVIADGSGLSRDNHVSSRVLAELLRSFHQDPQLGPVFINSLSYNGKIAGSSEEQGDGTLDGRFKKLPPGHWVYGKSGYIRAVSSLSGYLIVTNPEEPERPKRTIAFSFLFNGFTPPLSNRSMKAVQDQLVVLIDQQLGQ